MTKEKVLEEVNNIFREVLENEQIVILPETVADDIEEWDSLTHIHLVVQMEKHFKIKFSSMEIQSWNNAGEMVDSIAAKTPAQ